MSIDEIITIAELNGLDEIKVSHINGIHKVSNLILAGPQGPIKVIIKE